MPDYAELEFSLFPRDPDSYSIDLRYNDPQDQASHTPVRGVVRLDIAGLRALRLDPAAYGKALSDSLFADPTVRSYYDQARTATQSQNKTLRLRLFLDPSLPALYDVRWETLRDPGDGAWLLTSENLLFTRFLSSNSWEQVQLRPKSDLKALLLVANPQDLAEGKYQVDGQTLASIDVPGEIERAQQNLSPIPADILASDPAKPGQASLSRLADAFRQSYDILYVVCHGALLNKEPAGAYLWLEGDDGKTSLTPASALVDRLRDLPSSARPRLVVLASCQSAGQAGVMRTSDAQGALAALGPQLAQAGIPAVLAMQGDISMDTVASFMPVFFRELVRDGQVDRAAAAARSAVRERADAWIPVLFLRLRGGRIWYVPGFGEDRADFEKWPALLRSINRSQCTPILGPGLYENILGTQRELSVRWAEAYHYPLEIHERESLPQVAQFLTVNQYEQAPFDELEEYLTQTIRTRFKDIITNGNQPTLDQLFDQVGTHLRQEDPADPYKVLAGLPIPVFITTNANNLLAGALKEVGKDPQVVLCPWNDSIEQMGSVYDKEPDYQPTPDRPLIYHMFGRLDEPDSIVLTEDNYFDFLIGITRNKDLVPGAVRRALADTSLLFLGFQMDDWQFRVLFRSILAQQGGERRSRYPHIAAQLEPDENRIPEPDRARRYLENYFFQGANISLFWGSVDDFMSELTTRLPQRAP